MGWIRDFFMGYAHGSSKARDSRIEGKIDDLSKKVDSLRGSSSSSSSSTKTPSERIGYDSSLVPGSAEYNRRMNTLPEGEIRD